MMHSVIDWVMKNALTGSDMPLDWSEQMTATYVI